MTPRIARLLLALLTLATTAAAAPLRIAMSLSDIPNLWGAPDGGFEGVRFAGYTLYDSLIEWDLSRSDIPSRLVPGLADSWSTDPAGTTWTFHLRAARFHDGSPFNAETALWNLDSLLNPKSPQFNGLRAGLARTRTFSITGYGKRDDHTIFLQTARPNALLPYEISSLFFVSPARFAALGSDWAQFSQHPSGTGPYTFVSLTPRREATLAANAEYWNPARIPKTQTLVLLPVPDANTRVAALRSGQIDMIDTVPPDAIASLKDAGFIISMNVYPHTWMWRLNFAPPSPFADVRIRRAVNLAIDRDAIAELVGDTGLPARGMAPPGSPWFGHPTFSPTYDPAGARALLAQAGYGSDHPVRLHVLISSNGGGQMVPLSMNELIQDNLRAVGIDVTYDVADFTTMINMLRSGAKAAHADAINISMTMQEPSNGVASYDSSLAPPAGTNWGFYNNPAFDQALHAAEADFDPARQDAALAHVTEILTNDAAALMVVHDLAPRALSPKLSGFIQAQNWYQDFTSIRLHP